MMPSQVGRVVPVFARAPEGARGRLAFGGVALVAGFLVTLGLQHVVRERFFAPRAALRAPTSTRVEPPSFEIDIHTDPTSARIWFDGRPAGVGQFRGTAKQDGAQHELRVQATGYTTHVVTFRDRPPPRRVELSPSEPDDQSVAALAKRVSDKPRVRARQPVATLDLERATEGADPRASMQSISEPVRAPKVRLLEEPAPRIRVLE